MATSLKSTYALIVAFFIVLPDVQAQKQSPILPNTQAQEQSHVLPNTQTTLQALAGSQTKFQPAPPANRFRQPADTAAAPLHPIPSEPPSVGATPRDNDPSRFLRWSYQDGRALLQNVAPSLPYVAAGSAALLAAGSQVDAPILRGIQHQDGLDGFLSVTNEFGSTKIVPAAAGLFAVSLLTDDAKFQNAAFTSVQSLAYSMTAVFAVKYAVGRLRPEMGSGDFAYDAFSGNTSFPSGHTAAAFAVITPWVMYYPNPLTYGLFAVSAGTAVARIAKDRHWPTDVLAGAAVGYFTARYLSNRHMNESGDEPTIQLTPMVAPEAVGLNLRVNLD